MIDIKALKHDPYSKETILGAVVDEKVIATATWNPEDFVSFEEAVEQLRNEAAARLPVAPMVV